MKKIKLSLIILIITLPLLLIHAFELNEIILKQNGTIDNISFTCFEDYELSINIMSTGQIKDIRVTIPEIVIRVNVMGTILNKPEEFPNDIEKDSFGMVRRIGDVKICYYRNGKLKEVGRLLFNYNREGFISSVGTHEIIYMKNKLTRLGYFNLYCNSNNLISKIRETNFTYNENLHPTEIGSYQIEYDEKGMITNISGDDSFFITILEE